MTPTCINRTDRKPEYQLRTTPAVGGASVVLRSVTDDDAKKYTQQLNSDGSWSEWHDGDWPGDAATAFLTTPIAPTPTTFTLDPALVATAATTNPVNTTTWNTTTS